MFGLQQAIRSEQSLLLLLAVVFGVVVGYGVIGFRFLISLFQLVFYGSGSQEYFTTLVGSLPAWQVLLAPTVGGLIIGLFVYCVMPGRRATMAWPT